MNIFQVALVQPLANGLVLFYNLLFHNMGLAIIGFSLVLRFVLNPLTKPYMESMKKMKDMEPELRKIKEKFKDDKKKQMEAQTQFYKEKGINPGGGCLPYILQIIVLIALFQVFNKFLSGDGILKLNDLLYAPLKFPEGHMINTWFIYRDITRPDVFSIPGIPFPVPGPILILAALVQFISAKIMAPVVKKQEKMAEKTKQPEDNVQTAMQSSMIYTFPLFTLVFGLKFPTGLALYWFLFSLWQTVQQYQSSGWGGLTPWISKLGLIKSEDTKK